MVYIPSIYHVFRKGINHTRMHKYKDNSVSMCWVKVKTGRRKHLMIGGIYREWQSPNDEIEDSSKDINDQIKRLEKIYTKVDEVCRDNTKVVYLGDMNIDQHAENDPMASYVNRKLVEKE